VERIEILCFVLWVECQEDQRVFKILKMSNEQSGDLSQKGVFSVGSRIKCRYKGNQVEGDVSGFHSAARLLMIRKFDIGIRLGDIIS